MKLFIALLFTAFATAQSIDAQFDTIYKNSNNYKAYKIVKRSSLQQLQKNTTGVIATLEDSITGLESVIERRDLEIENINGNLEQTSSKLETAIKAKSTLDFMGMEIDKGLYNTIVWSLIGLLAVILIVLGIKFKNSNHTATDAERRLNATEKELDELRQKSIEKEQRLGRQLQDERMKVAKLKGQ
ncbi:MAG: hypothetical protein WBA16_07700 [Nonlabens sp.]